MSSSPHQYFVRPRKLNAYKDDVDLSSLMIEGLDTQLTPIKPNKYVISLDTLKEEVERVPEHFSWIRCMSPCPKVALQGEVVRGFGRGSSDLGCPTANL